MVNLLLLTEHTAIPDYFLHFWAPIIGPAPSLIYLQILKHAKNCRSKDPISLSHLVEETGLFPAEVEAHVRLLVQFGLLIEQKKDDNGSLCISLPKTLPLLPDELIGKLPPSLQSLHRAYREQQEQGYSFTVETPAPQVVPEPIPQPTAKNPRDIARIRSVGQVYEEEIGKLSASIIADIRVWQEVGMSDELIIEAIHRAAMANIRRWSYVKKILQDCLRHEIFTVKQFQERELNSEVPMTGKRARSGRNSTKKEAEVNYNELIFVPRQPGDADRDPKGNW